MEVPGAEGLAVDFGEGDGLVERSVGGACGKAALSPTATMDGKELLFPPALRRYISMASTRSFSVSPGRSMARNMANAFSAMRMAERI